MKNTPYIIILILLSCILNSACVATSQEKKLVKVSERWKKSHDISDFNYLKDHYILLGTHIIKVKKLLGKPLCDFSDGAGKRYLMYTKCDVSRNQYYAWTCVIDKNGKVIEWYRKGIR